MHCGSDCPILSCSLTPIFLPTARETGLDGTVVLSVPASPHQITQWADGLTDERTASILALRCDLRIEKLTRNEAEPDPGTANALIVKLDLYEDGIRTGVTTDHVMDWIGRSHDVNGLREVAAYLRAHARALGAEPDDFRSRA